MSLKDFILKVPKNIGLFDNALFCIVHIDVYIYKITNKLCKYIYIYIDIHIQNINYIYE